MESDLLEKKQILDIFENLDDSDDEPDQGRRASEQALKKRADSRALARSTSDTILDSRASARNIGPSSTDPLNASRDKHPLPSTLKKSVSDVARKPAAPAPVTGKRKRESSFRSAPQDQQIFRGLVFFFFPNDDKNPVRRMRINKAREYGAVWQRDLDDQVTHVISDKNMDFASLLKWLQVEQLPTQVTAVSEAWPAECLAYRTLLDPTHPRFAVKGHQRLEAQVPSTRPSVTVAESSESDKSLHLKPPGKDITVRRAETPSREGFSMESTAVSDFAREREPSLIPTSFIDTTIDSSKELDDAIARARQLQHIPFDDEEANSRPTSSEGPLADDEGLKLLTQRKTQRKRLREQEKWQCMQKHDGNKSGNPNEATIDVLQQMADYYGQIGDEWRIRAYRKAIATLRNHSVKVSTKEEAGALPNVGPRLAEKIEEIAFTNRLRRLDNAKAEPQDQVLQTFMGVYGAGPKKATEWVEQGYQTLDELMEKAELTANQRIGIEHYQDFQARIPRAEVAEHGSIVRRALQAIDPAFEVIIGGSFRRGSATSGDIDCIITRPDTGPDHLRNIFIGQLVPRLTAKGFLVASLAITARDDGSKWHGASCLPGSKIWRRLDFLLVPSDELGAALIYFTGNDIFNRSLRLLASTKGMRLNQRGLYRDVMRGKGRIKLTDDQYPRTTPTTAKKDISATTAKNISAITAKTSVAFEMPEITTESSPSAMRVDPLSNPTFDCVACMEKVTGRPAAVIHSCDICQECFDDGIRSQFQAFLKDETKQPKWAGKHITVESVKCQFSADFLEQLHARMAEYAILPTQRVYCASSTCDEFLGPADEAMVIKTCKCGNFTCAHCKRLADTRDHTCEDAMDIDQPDPFDGLIRGQDYQFCPNSDCKAPVSQIDGCNHMICEVSACETEFCYICGEPAKHPSTHWENPQGCPKYGRKGDARAIFDDPINNIQRAVIDNIQRDVDAMKTLEDPFDITDVDVRPEQRIRMIDRLELSDTLGYFDSLLLEFEFEFELPDWFEDLYALAHMLLHTLHIYTLHLDDPQAMPPARQTAEIHILLDTLPLAAWQQFPRIRPIVDTYLLALEGDSVQVASHLDVRREAAHLPRRRRHSEVAPPILHVLTAYEHPDTLSLEWPLNSVDAARAHMPGGEH
ncbi:hypothetical protein AC578_7898 [Pseudocercospora eumusae]|uniref:DNA polymerase lambda n=1 Tax=Pseudocercospora eumusae TaxID=321146 RepID=A0A139HP45_9PEZI|nr:hypothetical protein AC578_7898 [Pseudocercospora eumusae]